MLPASLAVLAALVPAAVSAQVTDSTKTTVTTTVTTQPVEKATVSPSDSIIVATLIAANQKEVEEAQVAISQAQSDRVKELARTLQRDHSKAVEELQRYLKKSETGMSSGVVSDTTKMNPPTQGNDPKNRPDSTYANQQTKNQPVTIAPPDSADHGAPSYQGKTGVEFDKAWIEAMEHGHEDALKDLRDDVIPRIQDSSLKALVQGFLPVIGNHLREIEAIEAELK